jgi:hypothetical protein
MRTLEIIVLVGLASCRVDGDFDAEVDAEVDAEADAEVDADVDADGDADVEAEVDADVDADGDEGLTCACDDDNPCTIDSCGEWPACIHEPAHPGGSCDGYVYCRIDTMCVHDGICDLDTGSDRDCDDGFDCTVDSCSEWYRACEHLPDHSRCDPSIGFCDPNDPDADDRGCTRRPG